AARARFLDEAVEAEGAAGAGAVVEARAVLCGALVRNAAGHAADAGRSGGDAGAGLVADLVCPAGHRRSGARLLAARSEEREADRRCDPRTIRGCVHGIRSP